MPHRICSVIRILNTFVVFVQGVLDSLVETAAQAAQVSTAACGEQDQAPIAKEIALKLMAKTPPVQGVLAIASAAIIGLRPGTACGILNGNAQ